MWGRSLGDPRPAGEPEGGAGWAVAEAVHVDTDEMGDSRAKY
jgi:hypothetical protein